LTAEYGQGFNRPNLFHTIRFAEVFPDEQERKGDITDYRLSSFPIISTLSKELNAAAI